MMEGFLSSNIEREEEFFMENEHFLPNDQNLFTLVFHGDERQDLENVNASQNFREIVESIVLPDSTTSAQPPMMVTSRNKNETNKKQKVSVVRTNSLGNDLAQVNNVSTVGASAFQESTSKPINPEPIQLVEFTAEGRELLVSSTDGKTFKVVKKKSRGSQQVLIVTIELEGEDINPATAKKTRGRKRNEKLGDTTPQNLIPVSCVTIDDEDGPELEVLEFVKGTTLAQVQKRPRRPVKAKIFYSTQYKGTIEILSDSSPQPLVPGILKLGKGAPPKFYNVDNLNNFSEKEAYGYISYLGTMVMETCHQKKLWEAMLKYVVPHTDAKLSTVLDMAIAEDDQLLDICRLVNRAFMVFLERAQLLYLFLFPHLEERQVDLRKILVEIWESLATRERERIYFMRHDWFDFELIDLVVQFPPGIVERRILQGVFPEGVMANPVPNYNQLLGDLHQQRAEAERHQMLMNTVDCITKRNLPIQVQRNHLSGAYQIPEKSYLKRTHY